MKTLRLLLGDQLSHEVSSLQDLDPDHDVVLMAEVRAENTYVPHHKQKIVLVLSAMRHFAQSLRSRGATVDYVELLDPVNSGTFRGELARALQRHQVDRVVVTEPGEWRVLQILQRLEKEVPVPLEIRIDDRFLCSIDEFKDWSEGRSSIRMEFFYRYMRRKTGWLMEGNLPVGGKWNYDSENRKSLPQGVTPPPRQGFNPDATTQAVIELAKKEFNAHFGSLESFAWGVTRENALEALDYFVSNCLAKFGDYQDSMKSGEDFLFHSALSPYLNIGLLTPREVCEAVLACYHEGQAPLPATEGFVRQIIGWREFVRGVYWTRMPDYRESNFLNARRLLPEFFWTGGTDLRCLEESISSTYRNAYAHHIQRLMVTGNFALLAGLEPQQVDEWYLVVYADAFEWVELPNTHGMALHADGGVLGSKPYAASGAYINRMSDYCQGCRYDPRQKLGTEACPFNYLYWNFLIENEVRLRQNPRMGLAYRTLGRMTPERHAQILEQSKEFLSGL